MCLRTRIVALVAIAVAAGFTGCAARSGPAGSDPDRVFVVSLQAEYHTQGDDKDDSNGISETFTYNTRVIAENRSHARAITFRENSQNSGQLFVLTKENQFPLSEISAVTYRYIMDNDDGWDVLIRIKARDSSGNEHLVGEEKREIGDGHPRQGTIPLRGSL